MAGAGQRRPEVAGAEAEAAGVRGRPREWRGQQGGMGERENVRKIEEKKEKQRYFGHFILLDNMKKSFAKRFFKTVSASPEMPLHWRSST
jgi:hypothetical protein